MRAPGFIISWLICFLPALSALALTPMDDAALDSVQARSGIAIAIDNVQVYKHEKHWGFRDTSEEEGTVAFENTTSYMIVNTRYPISFRPFLNPDGIAMVGLEALSYDDGPAMEIVLLVNTENLVFNDESLGSLHFRSIPLRGDFNPSLTIEEVLAQGIADDVFEIDGVTGELTVKEGQEEEAERRFSEYQNRNLRGDYDKARIGFMEEFALYVAPIGALSQEGYLAGYEGRDGIGFQFQIRSGIDEFRWDYNKEEPDQFRIGGAYMANFFEPGEPDPGDPDYDPDSDPATWGDPVGRFTIGDLNPYGNSGDIAPATFRVAVDDIGPFLRFSTPMQGSLRIEEIGMFAPQYENGNVIGYEPADLGPVIIDGMTVHHMHIDFRP